MPKLKRKHYNWSKINCQPKTEKITDIFGTTYNLTYTDSKLFDNFWGEPWFSPPVISNEMIVEQNRQMYSRIETVVSDFTIDKLTARKVVNSNGYKNYKKLCQQTVVKI